MLAAVALSGRALMYASGALRADREVVLAAVAQDGWALQHASPELRTDRNVVLAAVAQSGYALKYASYVLRNDQEIVLSAVAQNPKALQYASSRLQDGGLVSYVRDILAYDQFVFARRDELQNSASTAVCNQKGLMGEIHAYMGIGLSTHNIQNAQRVASSLGLNTSSEAPHAACRKSTLEVSLSGNSSALFRCGVEARNHAVSNSALSALQVEVGGVRGLD